MIVFYFKEDAFGTDRLHTCSHTVNFDKFCRREGIDRLNMTTRLGMKIICLDLMDSNFGLNINQEKNFAVKVRRANRRNKNRFTNQALKYYIKSVLLGDVVAEREFRKAGYEYHEGKGGRKNEGFMHTSSGYMVNLEKARDWLSYEDWPSLKEFILEYGNDGLSMLRKSGGTEYIELGLFVRALDNVGIDNKRSLLELGDRLKEYWVP